MASDPFDALYIPTIAVRPLPAFMNALQHRVHAVLGVPAPSTEGEPDMSIVHAPGAPRSAVEFALHYRNVNAALHWLEDILGLSTEWVHPQTGSARHAGLRWGHGTISINYKRGIYELGPGAVVLAVDSNEDLDARYRGVIATGGEIARPLGPNWDQTSRNFVVRDLEGNLWELAGPHMPTNANHLD